MNFFVEQGRCRVCGKIFCCSVHQHKHEYEEHIEYSYWLDVLPTACRRCRRKIVTIYDLNTKCYQMKKHSFNEGVFEGTPRPNRKRKLILNVSECGAREDIFDGSGRKMVAASKFKRIFTPPSFYLVDLNGIRITDAAINNAFSPQLSVSYSKLADNVKSSTPLIDEKENIAVLAVSAEEECDSDYATPENRNTSLILVSALKKNSTPFDGVKKNDGRKVTFKNVDSTESDVSVYGTPVASMCTFDGENVANTCEIVLTLNNSAQDVGSNIDDLTANESENWKIGMLVRSVRYGLNGIPRSIYNIWGWTQNKMRKRKTVTFQNTVFAKRKRWDVGTLRRRPISSQWVNMNVSSLVRQPLPAYVGKYNVLQSNYDDYR